MSRSEGREKLEREGVGMEETWWNVGKLAERGSQWGFARRGSGWGVSRRV